MSELLPQEFDGDDSLDHNYNNTNRGVMAGEHARAHILPLTHVTYN